MMGKFFSLNGDAGNDPIPETFAIPSGAA